jgi:hypothetical protein
MQWDEVAKRALIELGRHGPDGLVVTVMFACLLIATWLGINGFISLSGLGMLCVLYVVLRWINLNHAVTMAKLPVDAQAARVAATKAPHRPSIGGVQGSLPLDRGLQQPGENKNGFA